MQHLFTSTWRSALVLFVLISGWNAQSSAQTLDAFLSHLAGLPSPAARETAIDSFWAQLPAVPWIDGDTAHFLYRGTATSMAVAGDFNGWNPAGSALAQASATTLWHRSQVFESDARLDYKLVRNGSEWILDPANPNTVSGGFGPNSELAMPDYIQPWEIETYAGVPAGTISTSSFASTETGKTYSLQIYLPPGYDDSRAEGYPVAYFQDGHEYVSLANAARIFDNLMDSGLIEPTIGVFVRPTNRNDEYAGSLRNAYADFFGLELVPYIDITYNTVSLASHRAVIGASFGGNISAIITMAYPELFGNCGLHSGAFWPNAYDTYNDWIAHTPSPELRVAAAWGTYEGSLVGNMNDFVDVLESDGTVNTWQELHEGHSWGLWRSTLDDMLIFFFPADSGAVGIQNPTLPEALTLFPNPASDRVWVATANTSPSELLLIDAGANVIIQRIAVAPGSSSTALNLEGLAPGLYQVIQRSATGLSTGRLVLLR